MDYSDLVTAIREDNTAKINEHLETLIPRLKRFLQVHMNASKLEAQDCAQEALLLSLEKIKEDKLEKPERVFSYLLTTCRNTYLKMNRQNKEYYYEDLPSTRHRKPRQLKNLMDKEREKLLQWCIQQLKKEYQKFIKYWFDHPDYEAKKVAEHFNLSTSNTWTRKHRIIKKLNHCYQKKSKL